MFVDLKCSTVKASVNGVLEEMIDVWFCLFLFVFFFSSVCLFVLSLSTCGATDPMIMQVIFSPKPPATLFFFLH